MTAVHSGLAFVGDADGNVNGYGCECGCQGSQMIFRSVWDRLIQQLFKATPLGMDSEDQLPSITIWEDGVELVSDAYPYSFHVTSESGNTPKPNDVILYKGRYYVIGEVD